MGRGGRACSSSGLWGRSQLRSKCSKGYLRNILSESSSDVWGKDCWELGRDSRIRVLLVVSKSGYLDSSGTLLSVAYCCKPQAFSGVLVKDTTGFPLCWALLGSPLPSTAASVMVTDWDSSHSQQNKDLTGNSLSSRGDNRAPRKEGQREKIEKLFLNSSEVAPRKPRDNSWCAWVCVVWGGLIGHMTTIKIDVIVEDRCVFPLVSILSFKPLIYHIM